MHLSRSTAMVAYTLLAVGCSGSRAKVEARPELIAPTLASPPTVVAATHIPVQSDIVDSIRDLVQRARERHPTAEAWRATRDAALAREATAGAWSNPNLDVHAGRTRPREVGIEPDVPYGVTLTQRLDGIGKRDARRTSARAQTVAVEADAAVALNDLEAEVRFAATALAVAQEDAAQATADAILAEEVQVAVARAHAAGDQTTATLSRTRLEAATATVRRDAARRAVDTAVAMLRLWCGEDLPDAVPVAELLPQNVPRLDPDRLEVMAHADPRVAALAATIRASEAQVAVERAARVPDLTVGIFADREDEKDTVGLSLSIEVPVWNQHGGPIAEADAQRRIAVAELRRRQVDQRLALAIAAGEYETARAQTESLRTTVIPLAEETLRLRTVGLANGDLSLTDLLEARRALLASQAAALDARRRTAEALVRLGRVVGRYDLTTATSTSTFPLETPP